MNAKNIFIAIVIIATQLLFGLQTTIAQTNTGVYTYKKLKNDVISINWSYPNMPFNHILSQAILDSSAYNLPIPQSPPRSNIPYIESVENGISIFYPKSNVTILESFDSGHIRGFKIKMPTGAQWFGGGERSLPMNRVGQRIPLYNNPHYGYGLNAEELNFSVPFIICSNGFGLLFDNAAKGYMDFGKTTPGTLEVGFETGNINMTVIDGKNMDEILHKYTAITGTQPLPPRWALGNFVSRFGYRSQAEVEQTVLDMKAAGFAMDGLIIDIFWFGDSIQGTLGNLEFVNKEKWPNPEGMLSNLAKQNVKPILVTEPFVLKNTKQFEAASPYFATQKNGQPYMLTDFYFGYGGLIDLFRKDARDWFFSFYKKYTDLGVAGWWGDLGEPEKHPEDMYHNLRDLGIKELVPANAIHNIYGDYWSKMLFENWQQNYPTKRLFYLNRAGFAGSQRYSIFPWTGDVSRSWEGLKAQLPVLQSMSISGFPYVHSDAGGFSMTDTDDEELYIRWLQMAALSPIFRPHGTALGNLVPNTKNVASEPVYKTPKTQALAKNIVDIRYKLLPYNYNLAWQATTTGKPFIRPMVYYNMQDSNLLKSTEQYMYGDAILVAPVTEPNASTQQVYFPAGIWYNIADNNNYVQGTGNQIVSTNINSYPAWIKAGSLLPIWEQQKYISTQNYNHNSTITVKYYPAMATASLTMYNDNGETPNANKQQGKYHQSSWTATTTEQEIVINIQNLAEIEGHKQAYDLAIPLSKKGRKILGVDKKIKSITINGNTIKLQKPKHLSDGKWCIISGVHQSNTDKIVISLK